MPFEVCGICGCEVGVDEIFEVDERRQGFIAHFACHCGGITSVAASPSTFIEWVNLNGALFLDLLERTDVEEIFTFWEDQASVDAASIPVEV